MQLSTIVEVKNYSTGEYLLITSCYEELKKIFSMEADFFLKEGYDIYLTNEDDESNPIKFKIKEVTNQIQRIPSEPNEIWEFQEYKYCKDEPKAGFIMNHVIRVYVVKV